VISRK
jgi:hypothetical protein